MFPKDFVWGVASSAYQVEGTDAKDALVEYKKIFDERWQGEKYLG